MNKLIMQIAAIIIAGIITLGLSIYSVLDSNEKDKLLAKKQEDLSNSQKQTIALQEQLQRKSNEIGEKQEALNKAQKLTIISQEQLQKKSDEIIELQNQLQKKSDNQIESLNRLANPIPKSLSMQLSATLKLSKQDYNDILTIYNLNFPKGNTNLLPFNSEKTNNGFDKINALKDIQLGFQIILTNNKGKILRIRINQNPAMFMGYNTPNMNGVFVMSLQTSTQKVNFDGLQIPAQDIVTNYAEPSILDFRNALVSISYNIFYPQLRQMGGTIAKMYVATNPEYVTLDIDKITLSSDNFSIDLTNLKEKEPHNYEGIWKGL